MQAKHVGKVVIGLHPRLQYATGGVVVIAGGLGALGSLVATWFAQQSADTRLVLLGRSGRFSPHTASMQLQQLLDGTTGCVVTLTACDTSCRADVAALSRGNLTPLKVTFQSSLSLCSNANV